MNRMRRTAKRIQAREMEDYTDYISRVIEDAVSKIGEAAIKGYDVYTVETEEIEHISRSGFWSSNDGGYEARGFTTLSSGDGFNPSEAQSIADDMMKQNAELVSDEMKREYPEFFEGVDSVGYREAEEADLISEFEAMEDRMSEDDTVMFSVGAMYEDINSNAQGQDKHQCYVWAAINFETPYHRRGRLEWYVSEEFEFISEDELKKKLNMALRKVTSQM